MKKMMKRIGHDGRVYEYDYKTLTLDTSTHEKIGVYAKEENLTQKDFVKHMVNLYESQTVQNSK